MDRASKTPLRQPGHDKLFRARLTAWFRRHGRDLPWRRTGDAYAILVSEMMLQQTQVATVIGYFNRWMKRFPDFAALAFAAESDVLHAWQGLGYYLRARNLHRAAGAVVERHAGKLPDDVAAIRALPGVGPYTAGAVATFAFDLPEPAVDGNAARVLARLFDFREPVDTNHGGTALRELAKGLQPRRRAGFFNAALMELGALVCLPRRPKCGACPVRAFCASPSPEQLPFKRPRPKTLRIEERRALVVSLKRILLRQEIQRRWRGLWTLPPADGADDEVLSVRYPITHHQVTMHVVRREPPKILPRGQKWFPVDDIESIPMPSPHRSALRLLLH